VIIINVREIKSNDMHSITNRRKEKKRKKEKKKRNIYEISQEKRKR
jgi:hypothetical protein